MWMRKVIQVPLGERAVVLKDQIPERYLMPGTYRFWSGAQTSVVRLVTDLVADLPAALRPIIPEHELRRVVVGELERAVVTRRGRVVLVLETGRHDVWVVDDVAIELIDVSGIACEPLRNERRTAWTGKGYVDTHVPDGAVGLRFVDERLDAILPPGMHAAWSVAREVRFVVVDVRERIVAITGQEVMTKDRVSLRVNASVTYRVDDPRVFVTAHQDGAAALYLTAQLLLREAIAGQTLDALLADRDIVSTALLPALVARGQALGLGVVGVGVKDLVLPGEMRTLLNRVIEAQKDAEANVIARREETAATRSLAQTAKVLSENPLLVRLKELEAYKDLASRVGTLHVVMGEAGLGKLELKS